MAMRGMEARMSAKRRAWTTGEVRRLQQMYCWSDAPINAICESLGRTQAAVGIMAHKLGLRRSTRFLTGPACRWQPGNRPWNAGRQGWQAGGRAKLTRFKKGHRGARQKPVGSERRTRDGWEVKVAEPKVWMPKPRYVWLQNFGEIPAGAIVRLKDGNPDNCAPENLMLITRAEHARMNYRPRRPKRKPTSWAAPLKLAA
jgi:hypothetical protein